jgi:hypothetical protein
MGADRIRPSEARIEAPEAGSGAWAPGDAVEGRGGVRPEKEAEYGEKKKGGKASVREAGCAAPTLAVATSQPTTAVAAQLRRKGATGRRRWSPSDRSSLLDCVLAYVNKAAVCSQGKRCAVQVCDFGGLGFS